MQGTSAIRGDGLYEGLSWVQTTLARRKLKGLTLKPVKDGEAVPNVRRQDVTHGGQLSTST